MGTPGKNRLAGCFLTYFAYKVPYERDRSVYFRLHYTFAFLTSAYLNLLLPPPPLYKIVLKKTAQRCWLADFLQWGPKRNADTVLLAVEMVMGGDGWGGYRGMEGEFHIYEWSVLNKERSQRTYTALSE